MDPTTELEGLLGSVREAMTSPVISVPEHTLASEAARILERGHTSGAPVTRDGQIVGVVTLSDLMARARVLEATSTGPFHRFEHLLAGIEVGQVMTREVATARAEWPLTRAVEEMYSRGVNRVPVVDAQGRALGILTRDDVIRAVALRGQPGAGALRGSLIEPG